LTNSSDWQPVT